MSIRGLDGRMASVTLSDVEVRGLLILLIDGILALEEGAEPDGTWTGELWLWIDLILRRMRFGGRRAGWP
jgi:hypothetical protein